MTDTSAKRGAARRHIGGLTVAGPGASHRVLDERLREEGRARIAEAALPLFAEHGYHATPVRAIADAVGLSVGSIFNYFQEKEEILRYILDSSQAQAEEATEAAQRELEKASEKDPKELFVGVYGRFVEATDAIRRFALLAYQETKSLDPERRRPLLERERRIASILKKAADPGIRAGVFSGAFLDLKIEALMILAHGWAVRRWALPQYRDVRAYFADLESIALSILAARSEE